jgi:PAS domain S-box-containing protein
VYIFEYPLANGYRLIAEAPFAEYQEKLLIKQRNGLLILLALTLLTLTVAVFIARRFSRDLVKLSVLTTDLPLQIINREDISWPESAISEINALIENFRNIAKELKEKFSQLARSNELLEARISERTRDLYREIAERKATEIDLRNSEERYRHIFENNHAIMLIIDPDDGVIVDANPAACAFYGYERDTFRTMRMVSINTMSPEDMAAAMKLTIEKKQHISIQDHRLVTGETRPVEVYCGPVDFQGKTLLYAIIHDIMERHNAEEKVRKMTEELEQRVASRTEALEHAIRELESFSYSVSHDLRGPVRNMNGLSHLLLEDYGGKLDETGSAYLHRIVAASSKMGHLIDDLLNLSRVSRHTIKIGTVDLSKIAREVVDDLSAMHPERIAEFTIATGLIVRGDPHLLRIVMDNLIGNAWKYSSRKEVARIEFGTTKYEGESVYFVRDNGAGFDMEYAGNLFNAFQRLHKADEFEGTGIGLATVQRIIQRHNGKVWGEGHSGEGATFYFTLP